MKKEHKEILRKLVLERRFPLTFENTTDAEREIFVQIRRENSMKQIRAEMHKAYVERDG